MNSINNINNNLHFGSLNNPIKPFTANTANGKLYFNEINYKNLPKNKFFKELAKFFLDNFANTSSHPFWAKCRKPTMDKSVYKDYISYMTNSFKKDVKNPDTTIMLARDSNKKIVAAITARPLDENSIIKDNDTLYIDCLAVDKKYRGSHVGEQLLNKTIESAKNRYSDSFVVAYKESEPFYAKQGYKELRATENNELKAINGMAPDRSDYPEYAAFITQTLDETKSRWYDRI